MSEELRELSFVERILWRLHFYFGYLAMKKTFDKSFAKEWYANSMATLERVPKMVKEDEKKC